MNNIHFVWILFSNDDLMKFWFLSLIYPRFTKIKMNYS